MLSDEEREKLEREFQYALDNIVSKIKGETATAIVCSEQSMILLFEKLMLKIEKQSKEIEEYKKQLDLDNECEIALNNRIMDLEKEIEELNFKNEKLYEDNLTLAQELKNADLTTVYINGVYDGEKKVQDKIKAKIEELDEEIKVKREIAKNPMDRVSGRLLTDSIVELEKTKKVLQSLLEKE